MDQAATQAKDHLQLARGLVNYFLDSHPQHSRALALKARILVRSDPPQDAEAIRIFESIGAATADDLYAWAVAYIHQGQWSRAAPLLGQVTVLEPKNSEARHELTVAHITLGMLDEALQSAKTYTEIPGAEAIGHLFQASIYTDLQDPAKACESYARVFEYSPNAENLPLLPEEVFGQYGSVLLSSGRTDDAIAVLQRGVNVAPASPLYTTLGKAHSDRGETDQAETAWKMALQIEPGNLDAREALANHALQTDRPDMGLELLAPIEAQPRLRASTAYLLQRLYTMAKNDAAAARWQAKSESLRQCEQAITSINNFLRQSPKSYWASVILAHRFASSGNWKQAEDMLRELRAEESQEPFVQQLADAVRLRGDLPPLESVPYKKF